MFTALEEHGYCPKHEAELGKFDGKENECCMCHPLIGDEDDDGCSDDVTKARL